MEFKNKAVAKVAAVATTLAMASSVLAFAPFVHAQTTTTTTTTTAVCSVGTTDLTVGATGDAVKCLQQALIAGGYLVMPAGVMTGTFGPLTKAAVSKWQTAKGIAPAAGYFGPISRAAFAPVAGGTGSTTPGCVAGAKFSSTTGAPCVPSTGTTTPPTTGGPLSGGAGSLDDADFVSALNNEEVGEGQEEVPVVGLDLDADDGSDLRVTSVKVSFEEQGAGGSIDLDDYADVVSVWFEGKMVGEADVADFSENSDTWSKTIQLDSDATIQAGETGRLEIAVTAQNSIDSSDLGSANNDWNIAIDNVRYEDGDGAIITENDEGDIGDTRSFFFDSFASANDVELKVSDNSDNPVEQVVTVDADGGEEITLLAGDLEADGSDVTLKGFSFDITAAGTGDASEIATRFKLMLDGDELDSLDSDECDDGVNCDGGDAGTATYTFSDFDDMDISDGDTSEFSIVAELGEVIGGTGFTEGDSLSVDLNSSDIDAEDESGDGLTGGELTGTANGEEQSFFSEGLALDDITTAATVTFTADDGGEESIGKFVVTFKATALEADVNLLKAGVSYTVDSTGTISDDGGVLECIANCGNSGDNTDLDFFIEEGDTETYRFTVIVTGDDTPQTTTNSVWIESMDWDIAPGSGGETYSSNLGEDSDADTGTLSLISL